MQIGPTRTVCIDSFDARLPWAGAMRKYLDAFSLNALRPLFFETGEVLSDEEIHEKEVS